MQQASSLVHTYYDYRKVPDWPRELKHVVNKPHQVDWSVHGVGLPSAAVCKALVKLFPRDTATGRKPFHWLQLLRRLASEVTAEEWMVLVNPQAAGIRNRYEYRRCFSFSDTQRLGGRYPQGPSISGISLWGQNTTGLTWHAPAGDPTVREGTVIPKLFTAEYLLQRLGPVPWTPPTLRAALRALKAEAFEMNVTLITSLVADGQRMKLNYAWATRHNIRRLLLANPHPDPSILVTCNDLQHWLQCAITYNQLHHETPKLESPLQAINAALPPEQRFLVAKDLKKYVESFPDIHRSAWRLLVKHGHAIIRPFLAVPCRRLDGPNWVITCLFIQARLGDGRLPPPWFMRQLIGLHQQPQMRALGEGGWLRITPELFKECVARARNAITAASRAKLIKQVAVLVAVGKQAHLEQTCKQLGFNAAVAAAEALIAASTQSMESLIAGFDWVRLDTPEALDAEGKAMKHCVSNERHGKYAERKYFRFISLRLRGSGQRLATATLYSLHREYPWRIQECKGYGNADVPEILVRVIQAYADSLAPMGL